MLEKKIREEYKPSFLQMTRNFFKNNILGYTLGAVIAVTGACDDCNGYGRDTSPRDSGASEYRKPDARVSTDSRDAGTKADAYLSPDAAIKPDYGLDAASKTDSYSPDAGVEPDIGLDAGTDSDASIDLDAGVEPDIQTCFDEDDDGFYAGVGCGTEIDCDDTDGMIYPGAPEVCNRIDDNCNGERDEGLNLEWECGVSSIGECTLSMEFSYCIDGDRTPWLGCDAVFPSIELCDDLDRDCDGDNYNGFNAGDECDNGMLGGCNRTGEFVCDSLFTTVCNALPGEPEPEVCDSLDHDCDGDSYNGFPLFGEECDNGLLGQCFAEGEYVCAVSSPGVMCNAPIIEPSEEICDGLDNDCDGVAEGILDLEDCLERETCFIRLSDNGETAIDGSSPTAGTDLTATGWLYNLGSSESVQYSDAVAFSGTQNMMTSGYNGAGVHYDLDDPSENIHISIWYNTSDTGADHFRITNADNTASVEIMTGGFCGSSHPFEYAFRDPSGESGANIEISGSPSYEPNHWYNFQISIRGSSVSFAVDDAETVSTVCHELSEPISWSRVQFGVDRCGGSSRTSYWDDFVVVNDE